VTLQHGIQGAAKETHREHQLRCSIILCTYNRRNLVLTALAALRRQTLPYELFEVIVVDNGSQDGTFAAVNAYVHAGPIMASRNPPHTWRVRCLIEVQNGLSYARKTGLQVAVGEIVVFLDDDAIAQPTFLECLLAAYDGTKADAIGGRVELRWEAPRPHWVSDNMLDVLGYFAPTKERSRLQPPLEVSSCNFSIKREVLLTIGRFSPLLGKRADAPISMEIADLCRRLHAAGYALWYEPEAIIEHRVPAARLTRPYFVGHAYWQGRSEVMAQYADTQQHQAVMQQKLPAVLRSALPYAQDVVRIAFIDRLLLFFAGKPSSERLLAAMDQARSWGHIQQRLQFVEHAPSELSTPSVFFVSPNEHDVSAHLLAQGLQGRGVRSTTSIADIPLAWLWQHRAFQGKAIGILHFYRPGAFTFTPGQSQRFWFLLWLAKRWGIRIVTTDTGGWWQTTPGLHALPRRVFEHTLLRQSDIILAFTRQPDQLYPDKRLRRRVRSLPHPGFRDVYPPTPARAVIYAKFGLPPQSNYVYLCLAMHHSERELLLLVDIFTEAQKTSPHSSTYLLLVGTPPDKQDTLQQRVKGNKTILFFTKEPNQQDISLYMAASDAVVLPHFAQHTAGMLEIAMLALSFERRIVVPDLPRFRGMLPPRAIATYNPNSRASLMQALLEVQNSEFRLKVKDRKALEAKNGWNQYAQRFVEIYKQVLDKP